MEKIEFGGKLAGDTQFSPFPPPTLGRVLCLRIKCSTTRLQLSCFPLLYCVEHVCFEMFYSVRSVQGVRTRYFTSVVRHILYNYCCTCFVLITTIITF